MKAVILTAIPLFFAFSLSTTHAATTCYSSLHDTTSQQKSLAALYEKSKDVSLKDSPELVHALVESNIGLFINANVFKEEPGFLKTLKVINIQQLAPHDRFPYYRAKIEGTYRGRAQEFQIFFRSNGSSAFLSSTWQLEQEREKILKPLVVFKNAQAPIESMTQTSAVLKTLPERVTLSRVMSSKEFTLWKSGDVSKIKSTVNGFGGSREAAPKTTFALNHYAFNGDEPYLFEIEKSKLLELEEQGLLSINTYEGIGVSKYGISAEGQTPFGLEVEIVVHGTEGRKQILSVMQSPLQVPK